MKRKVNVFLFDGFSDWEISYLTPEINKSDQFDLIYSSTHGGSVTSGGGLTICNTAALSQVLPEEVSLLVLPGGSLWESEGNHDIKDTVKKMVKDVFEQGKTIGAICGATIILGQLGLLNSVRHTSNDLNYLKGFAPGYAGDKNYQNAMAVADHNIITANGVAPIEFAKEILKKIKLFDDQNIEKWFQLFKNGIWNP